MKGPESLPYTSLFPTRARPSGETAKQRPLSESRPARVTLRRNAYPGKPFPATFRAKGYERATDLGPRRSEPCSGPAPDRSSEHPYPGETDTQRRSYKPCDALRLSASGRKSRYSYPCASYSRDSDSKRLRKSG